MKRPRALLHSPIIRSLALASGALALASPGAAWAADKGELRGVVRDESASDKKIADAYVVLQCNCLQGERPTRTNADGLFQFKDLPPGVYTVQVFVGKANDNQVVDLKRGEEVELAFSLDPEDEISRTVVIRPTTRNNTTTGDIIETDKARHIPVGGTDRDFSGVVEMSPTVQRGPAGARIAGTGGDESKYIVGNADVTSPSFGTVGATIVQEFIDEVEVLEAGYDAEFGGASGGIVRARRRGGSNKVRGEIALRYTPRGAAPRLVINTDEAVRAAVVTDHQMEAVGIVTGPIIKDRLFFAVGLSPSGNVNSLIQSFHARQDRDRSGGYAGCPYKNGEFDCADGTNNILTHKFAEQKFTTGQVGATWTARFDWVVTPKHQLSLSGGGRPGFAREPFRLPLSSTPNAFGTNPAAGLGGASRTAFGIVNNNFGWNLGNQFAVGLDYSGRVLNDSLEIDAGVFLSQSQVVGAWRLDDEAARDLPVSQEQDNQGRNLYELLDRDGAVHLVRGVQDYCNNSGLPGLACPTRRWLSGGLGQYNTRIDRRVGGTFALTHFFNVGPTNHQLKYGTQIQNVTNDTLSRFSGRNDDDFYNNCPTPQQDGAGGEFCHDPATDTYTFDTINRVNNNRAIIIQSDNPNRRFTTGFGRTRREQGDLRAIATPIGAGARAPFYDAILHSQVYAVYLQDRMQILPGLYLNPGVRWDIQDMRDLNGERAVFLWDQVAPRLGVTYDWTEEGKSRLYASYGWFYRELPLQLSSRVFGGLVEVSRSYQASNCSGTVNLGGEDHAMTVQGQPTEYCVDTNVATTGLTVGSIVPRLRGQYNEQFQLGYEHEVVEDLLIGVHWLHNGLGRAVEDVSTNGGLNFIIANPGVAVSEADIMAQQQVCDGLQAEFDASGAEEPGRDVLARELHRCNFLVSAYDRVNKLFDRPIRNYDAWTLKLRKRFAKNWILSASYTFSRLIGNYDGSVDRNTGAITLGASTQYDIPELVRNSYGPLFNDRPHTVKLDGFYQFDLREVGRLTLGASFRFLSGTPVSLYADNNRYRGQSLIYVLPRGAGGRLSPLHQLNLQVGYAYPLPGELELEFNTRVINVYNSKIETRVDETYSFQTTRPVPGGDLDDLKHVKVQNPGAPTRFYQAQILGPQGNFGTQLQFQQPLSLQFELRLRF